MVPSGNNRNECTEVRPSIIAIICYYQVTRLTSHMHVFCLYCLLCEMIAAHIVTLYIRFLLLIAIIQIPNDFTF